MTELTPHQPKQRVRSVSAAGISCHICWSTKPYCTLCAKANGWP